MSEDAINAAAENHWADQNRKELSRLRAEVERLKADRDGIATRLIAERDSASAEIQRLRKALGEIRLHTDPEPDAEDYRIDDSEGCLDAVFDIARAALDGGKEGPKP